MGAGKSSLPPGFIHVPRSIAIAGAVGLSPGGRPSPRSSNGGVMDWGNAMIPSCCLGCLIEGAVGWVVLSGAVLLVE